MLQYAVSTTQKQTHTDHHRSVKIRGLANLADLNSTAKVHRAISIRHDLSHPLKPTSGGGRKRRWEEKLWREEIGEGRGRKWEEEVKEMGKDGSTKRKRSRIRRREKGGGRIFGGGRRRWDKD